MYEGRTRFFWCYRDKSDMAALCQGFSNGAMVVVLPGLVHLVLLRELHLFHCELDDNAAGGLAAALPMRLLLCFSGADANSM